MAVPSLTFEFAVFVNGVEQPGTRFVTTFPTGIDSNNQKQLTGVCHISCDDEDTFTIKNVGNGDALLSASSSTQGPVTVASVTVRRAGSVLIIT